MNYLDKFITLFVFLIIIAVMIGLIILIKRGYLKNFTRPFTSTKVKQPKFKNKKIQQTHNTKPVVEDDDDVFDEYEADNPTQFIEGMTEIQEWIIEQLTVSADATFYPNGKNTVLSNIIDTDSPRAGQYYIELGRASRNGNYIDSRSNIKHICLEKSQFDHTICEKHLRIHKENDITYAEEISFKGNTVLWHSDSGKQEFVNKFVIQDGTIARMGDLWIRFKKANNISFSTFKIEKSPTNIPLNNQNTDTFDFNKIIRR